METQENKPQTAFVNFEDQHRRNDRFGRLAGGLILVAAGGLLFARKAGVWLPEWIFSFEMFLIVLGAFIWARQAFRRPGGLILMLVGGFFILDDIIPGFYIGNYFWPIVITAIGLWIMFAPTGSRDRWKRKMMRKNGNSNFQQPDQTSNAPFDPEEIINSTTVFGACKKNIFSRDFKGGEADTYFGGTEINLSQADIKSNVVLEITQVFAGTKIIVPVNWQVKSEMVAVIGGIEDKRPVHPARNDEDVKTLILRGTTIFGGVDIKSY